jgi:uncharacterized protein YbjT (DUF2867 family)
MKIAIAGANGFVGKSLLKSLKNEDVQIQALSRNKRNDHDKNVHWVQADLFSFQSTLKALEGCDVAFYLVHSMLPSTRLFQGNFQDTDLFLADNFSKAAKIQNIKHIIYLGGLVPEGKISLHLESRREVEDVLKASSIPVTILRAGLVVGDGGSSFEILKNLVLNLPVMVLPRWTKSKTQAIFIDDLIRVLKFVMGNETCFNKTLNVVNGECITYKDLIVETASYFGKSGYFFPIPINYMALSKWWVKLFGEAHYELVSPLLDSLECDLPMSSIPPQIEKLIEFRSFKKMLEKIPKSKRVKPLKTSQSKIKGEKTNTVRSIQRLSSNIKSEKIIGEEYFNWLPKIMNGLLKARREGEFISFHAIGLKKPLLILKLIPEEISIDRIKFYIIGGLLTKTTNTGWLEFRVVAGGQYVLASINEFIPALPWYFYKYTQAPIHSHVMNKFSDYLSKLDN